MAVIRCQACGKPNPDFLEQCQYCEARLTPLQASAEDTLIRPPADTVRCQACGVRQWLKEVKDELHLLEMDPDLAHRFVN